MNKKLVVGVAAILLCSMLSAARALRASAVTPTLTVTPTSGLLNGQLLSVPGARFQPQSEAGLAECSKVPGQPTMNVAGFTLRVSCAVASYGPSYPFSNPAFLFTSSSGDVDTSYVVHTGIVRAPDPRHRQRRPQLGRRCGPVPVPADGRATGPGLWLCAHPRRLQ